MTRMATFTGGAGEWMHYATATWLAFDVGGARLSAVYLVALCLPGALIPRVNRAGGFLAPVAAGILAAYWTDSSPEMIAGLGLAGGLGAAASMRPPAWTAGINGNHGFGGIAGAFGAAVASGLWGPRYALGASAVLMLIAWVAGERHQLGGSLSPAVVPAAAGVAFAAGLRVLEPKFFGDAVSAGLFVTAWAVGVHFGWRLSSRADARAIIAAPFLAGAGIAVFGVVEGPSMPFLYASIGFCVGLVGGTSEGTPPERLWSPRRHVLLIGAMAGAAWIAAREASLETQTLAAAAVALFGGFASLTVVRRMWKLETFTAEAKVAHKPVAKPSMATGYPEPLTAAQIAQVVSELRAALTTARAIREEALRKFHEATVPPADPYGRLKESARAAIDELIGELSAAELRVRT